MIHVIGNAAVDMILRIARFPRPGETLVAESAVDDLGGKGANQAVAIARCGEPVALTAALGADPLGERIRSRLAAEGVETGGLWVWPGPTDRCVIYVDGGGENTIVSLIEAARHFDPLAATQIADRIAPGDWVVLQGNLRPLVSRNCLALARRRGATTVLNPSPAYAPGEYDWSLVDLAVLNRGEAIELGRSDDPIAAAGALRAAGLGAAVLTLGAQGAVLLSGATQARVAAPRVPAVDTIAAGDVFCGSLIAARAKNLSWSAALRVAAEAAAICVSRPGAQASFPTRAEMSLILTNCSEAVAEEPR
ncbi:MAG TPA: ribokinase [Roseiarcus sp.]|nr:ribokinase [Roseiarcus sp.]